MVTSSSSTGASCGSRDAIRLVMLNARPKLEIKTVAPCSCAIFAVAKPIDLSIVTPATKAAVGHDLNISEADAEELCGAERYAAARAASLELYRFASAHAEARGIVLADTKFELGVDRDGSVVLGDEALTPDSSRFWPADRYREGISPPSFDKQYVRDYLETLDWDKTAPGPRLPAEVIAHTAAKYREAYERLTGQTLD